MKAIFAQAPLDWSPAIETFDRHGCPETLQEDDPPALVAHFEEVKGVQDRIEALRQDLLGFGLSKFETQSIAEENWAESWKQFFKVRKIGRVVIRPTWEDYEPAQGEVVIDLDPGQAFGTGDHPTTRLCLSLMQEIDLERTKVADIGCGSGILAIAACKLGAREVVAGDIDAQSVEIAKDNAKRNGVEITLKAEADLDAMGDEFDLVVSNIITATLTRLAPDVYDILDSVGKGGFWIVSGIIRDNWEGMKNAAEACGFKLIKREEEDEWVGATFRR